jgi:hypothetical protein
MKNNNKYKLVYNKINIKDELLRMKTYINKISDNNNNEKKYFISLYNDVSDILLNDNVDIINDINVNKVIMNFWTTVLK